MKKWLMVLLCGLLMLTPLTGCEKEAESTTPQAGQEQEQEEELTSHYVSDVSVNQFLADYEKYTHTRVQGLHSGTLEGEYIFTVNLCEIRLRSIAHGLHIEIWSGDTEKDAERLYETALTVCKIADSSCTAQQAKDLENWMRSNKATVGDFRVCNYVKVLSYTPVIENETVKLDCNIRLFATRYPGIIETTE